MPSAFFLLLRILLAVLVILCFYTKLKVSFSISAANLIVDYIEFVDCFDLFQYILSTPVLTSRIIGICLERRERKLIAIHSLHKGIFGVVIVHMTDYYISIPFQCGPTNVFTQR